MMSSNSASMSNLLRWEGGILCAGAIFAYFWLDGSWLWFVLLLLVFDVSMVGYLKNPRLGALTYNLGHSVFLPGLLVILAWAFNWRLALFFGLIWLAHIGLDRGLGYGLKYPDDFKHTHLGWIGKK